MSWTVKKLDTFAGPDEIRRTEVSWILKKKLDTFAGPGEIKRGGGGGGTWCWTLKLAQKRS